MNTFPGNPEVKPFLQTDSLETGETLAIQVNNMGGGSFTTNEIEGDVSDVTDDWIEIVPHGADPTHKYTIQFSSAGVGMCYFGGTLIGPVNSVHRL